ncbi:hypothetical protein [Candidatus Nitrosocosmicus sp. T]
MQNKKYKVEFYQSALQARLSTLIHKEAFFSFCMSNQYQNTTLNLRCFEDKFILEITRTTTDLSKSRNNNKKTLNKNKWRTPILRRKKNRYQKRPDILTHKDRMVDSIRRINQ